MFVGNTKKRHLGRILRLGKPLFSYGFISQGQFIITLGQFYQESQRSIYYFSKIEIKYC